MRPLQLADSDLPCEAESADDENPAALRGRHWQRGRKPLYYAIGTSVPVDQFDALFAGEPATRAALPFDMLVRAA